MKLNILKYWMVMLLPVLIVSCSKDGTSIQVEDQYVKVADVVSSDSYFNVQFYAKDSLFVGYNKVFFKVTDKSSGLPCKSGNH